MEQRQQAQQQAQRQQAQRQQAQRQQAQRQQAQQHYSPASVGGEASAAMAARVSRAYSESYRRGKALANRGVELLGYLPPDQPQDDLWSGSPLDERFWRSDASHVVSRQATGLTREQRAVIDGAAPDQPPPPGGAPAARFFESTKSRHLSGR